MTPRRTRRIEVGTFENKVGFTMYFDQGEKEHFLFSVEVADSLATKLLHVISEVKAFNKMFEPKGGPGDSIATSDGGGITIV